MIFTTAAATVLAGCGKTLGPEDLARLEFATGNGQTAVVGTAVETPPAVRALSIDGEPVPGVTVTFEVAEGGGTITGGSATTGADGIAAVGSWTLGPAVGSNALTATVPDGPGLVRFLASGVVGPPSIVEKLEGDQAEGTAGLAPEIQPKVRVTDALGNPVAGVDVTFAVATGGGAVDPDPITSDEAGEATAVDWVLGAEPGENTLTASAAGVSSTFTVTGVAGPVSLEIADGDMQTAVVGTAVPVPPRVSLRDARDLPSPDVAVVFRVVDGAGGVAQETVMSDANGEATVEWTLGTATGANVLAAEVADLASVEFEATAVADVPTAMIAVAGVDQFGAIDEPLAVTPAVFLTDQFDNAVPDVDVTFTITGGGGSVTGAVATTDDDGIASPDAWILGPAEGANSLEATFAGLPAVTFDATALTAVFDIETVRLGAGGPAIAQALVDAVAVWRGLVIGDLEDVSFATNPVDSASCGDNPAFDDVVDDVRIFVQLEEIDGPGGVLGSAGPCITRDVGGLTVVGAMRFDVEDLDRLAEEGRLTAVVLHEIGHVLGIGTLWDALLVNPSLPNDEGADTHFTGARTIAAFDDVGGNTFTSGSKVPVENSQGGQGTRDSHWRESVFQSELMTGFIDPVANPLSIVTVESLGDIGYFVNPVGADDYILPGAVVARQTAGRQPLTGFHMVNDVRRGPIYSVTPDGRVTAVRNP